MRLYRHEKGINRLYLPSTDNERWGKMPTSKHQNQRITQRGDELVGTPVRCYERNSCHHSSHTASLIHCDICDSFQHQDGCHTILANLATHMYIIMRFSLHSRLSSEA